MPLIKSASKKAVGQNISREMAAGKSQRQAVAIVLAVKRRAAGQSSQSQRAIESKRPNLPASGLPGLPGLRPLGVNLLKRPRISP